MKSEPGDRLYLRIFFFLHTTVMHQLLAFIILAKEALSVSLLLVVEATTSINFPISAVDNASDWLFEKRGGLCASSTATDLTSQTDPSDPVA